MPRQERMPGAVSRRFALGGGAALAGTALLRGVPAAAAGRLMIGAKKQTADLVGVLA